MQNENGPKSPPKTEDVSLRAPHPPRPEDISPEVQDNITLKEGADKEAAVVMPDAPADEMPEKVQDLDWNNGRPEVTDREVTQLPSHQTAEIANGEALRENKGTRPGDKPFEASEEVATGQSGG